MHVLFKLLLPALILLSTGCATRQAAWVAANDQEDTEQASLLLYKDAREVIKMMALPGDILLLHVGHSRTDLALSQRAIFPITIADIADLQDPFTTYLHAEYVTGITPSGRLKARGYYPIVKRYKGEQHRNYFSIYRIAKPELQTRPLEKEKTQSYLQIGYCGDYIAWAYDNQIYAWWNRIPVLQQIIGFAYPPEAIHTPDSIANSPDTLKVLEVFNGEVVYPELVDSAQLIKELEAFVQSSNADLAAQAQKNIDQLKAQANGGLLRFERIE